MIIEVDNEEIHFDHQNLTHTPLISQIANAIIGEKVNMPFTPMVKDDTPHKSTVLKKQTEQALRQYLNEKLIEPTRTKIMNSILQSAGQEDVFAMASSPEMQMQLDQEINQAMVNELPIEIMEFMQGRSVSVTVRQAQRMINHLGERFNIKFKTIEGFKFAVTTGEEYYFSGLRGGKLLFEAIHPGFITWGVGDAENEWLQYGDWVKRERWPSYQQFISTHASDLDEKHIIELDVDFEPIGGVRRDFWDKNSSHTKNTMHLFTIDEGLQSAFTEIDIKSKEGRKNWMQLYNIALGRYGDTYGSNFSNYGVREAHFQWRDLRPMWEVTRKDEHGRDRTFHLPEHYEPTHLDTEVKKVWRNQIWQGYKAGSFSSIYFGIEPKPYQYKSVYNPNDVDLSYYGKMYNTHKNTTENVSIVDLGKTANKNFDMILASIRTDMATDIGSVFTMFLDMKPESYTTQQWLDVMRYMKIMMLDPTKNFGGVDPQFLKSINLSRVSDMAGKFQLLEFFRLQVANNMYFNNEREGAVGQYANTQNIQQNTTASYNKTALFFEQHRLVVEKALTGLLNEARFYFRENPEEAAVFLDDIALADLQVTPISHYEWLGIILQNSQEELAKLQAVKGQSLNFIQNSSSFEAVTDLIMADTISDVREIMRKETERLERLQKEAMENARAEKQMELQAKAQEKQMEIEARYKEHREQITSQEKRVLWDREKFKMQNDVNDNQVHDLIEKTILELQAQMAMKDQDLQVEREKIASKERTELAKNIRKPLKK